MVIKNWLCNLDYRSLDAAIIGWCSHNGQTCTSIEKVNRLKVKQLINNIYTGSTILYWLLLRNKKIITTCTSNLYWKKYV